MAESLPRSTDPPHRKSGDGRPTLSLGNQDSDMGTSIQALHAHSPPVRSTKNIPTFFIWSIFNLLFLPLGILCCYFSHRVSHFKIQNRYELANKWSKRTFVLNLMTDILMIGVIITAVMLHYDYVQNHPNLSANETRTTGAFIPWQPGR
jgi:hypothetical protein